MRRFAGAVALCGSFFLAGCAGSPSSSSSTPDCSVAGENAQILSAMRSWYYWYQSLSPNVNPAGYASPDALLDALRYQPLDRFTYVTTQAADQSFYGAGQYAGFGLGLSLSAANVLRVTRVFAGSPAAQAGLARGDTITAVNGTALATLIANKQLDNVLFVGAPGVSVTLTTVDLSGQSRTVSLTSAVVTEPTVEQTRTFTVGQQKVGYVLFNSFITPSKAALDQAVAGFAAQGVTQLVIDERYNGGGLLSVAAHLASLAAGNAYAGRTLGTLTFNSRHTDQNLNLIFETVNNPLNLTQVLFVTSGSTASASEFVINALSPYIHVTTVGSATFGKPVGEIGLDVCSDVLYPITFKIANVNGAGDYFDGLPAACAAADDLTHALGDPAEASVAAALSVISTGGCPAGTAAAARAEAQAQALRPRRETRYGWRQLVNAY
jgi:membrane-associated protease RseP (regulator of RpoE activity)